MNWHLWSLMVSTPHGGTLDMYSIEKKTYLNLKSSLKTTCKKTSKRCNYWCEKTKPHCMPLNGQNLDFSPRKLQRKMTNAKPSVAISNFKLKSENNFTGSMEKEAQQRNAWKIKNKKLQLSNEKTSIQKPRIRWGQPNSQWLMSWNLQH